MSPCATHCACNCVPDPFAWDCNQKALSLKPEAVVLSCHPPMSLPLETMFCYVHAYFHSWIKHPYANFICSFGTFLLLSMQNNTFRTSAYGHTPTFTFILKFGQTNIFLCFLSVRKILIWAQTYLAQTFQTEHGRSLRVFRSFANSFLSFRYYKQEVWYRVFFLTGAPPKSSKYKKVTLG